jgi:hypothetical protein
MISSKEISVVIQGPLYNEITPEVIRRVRYILPEAEIIYSTWNGTNYASNLIDAYVESVDPGGMPIFDNPKILHAANRQIISTLAGLNLSTRKYALKIRSDLYLESINFLEEYSKFPLRSSKYRILSERIIVSTSFTPNPRREPKPFHPSDWFYFGLKDDLLRIFDIPLCVEPETSRYFESRKRPRPTLDSWVPALCRYTAEQYIWVAFLKKFIDLKFEHCFDICDGNIELSEIIFANNVIMLEAHKIRYKSLKHKDLRKSFDLSLMYTHNEWHNLYIKHCGDKKYRRIFDAEKILRLLLCYYHPKMIYRNVVALLNIKVPPFLDSSNN